MCSSDLILGECDLATRPANRNADHAPVFATIRKRAQRLKLRVEDLLRVARSESGEIELDRRALSAVTVLSEAVDNIATEAARRRIALTLEPGDQDIEILADREWLRQVIESLVDNAFRHATGLSRVTVSLAAAHAPDGPVALIAILDDGPGFGTPQDALFERFRRGDLPTEAGFGIGLALARWLVEQHDGTIRLGAGPDGRGARVTLAIPVLDGAWDMASAAKQKDDAA